MNTNDVRNMHINQWIFWAVALPLAVVVITLCLMWTGELSNFWKGFENLWRRGDGKRTLSVYNKPLALPPNRYYPPVRAGMVPLGPRDWEDDYYVSRPR